MRERSELDKEGLRIPVRDEINPAGPHDLDAEWAAKNLHGKTIGQVTEFLREGFLWPYGDMLWMGPAAFGYYVRAACRFFLSQWSTALADDVNHFPTVFGVRLDENHVGEISLWSSAIPECLAVCRHVLANYDRYEIEPEIYGDLRPEYRDLSRRLESLAATFPSD